MTINAAINHWPVFKAIRLCGEAQGTADPRAPITCKCCREKLEAKVAAHTAQAKQSRGQEARFFAADAARWQATLDGVSA